MHGCLEEMKFCVEIKMIELFHLSLFQQGVTKNATRL